MDHELGMEGVWMTKIRISITGFEESKFLCNNECSQSKQPSMIKAMRQAAQGKGKHWVVQGCLSDTLMVQIRVLDGDVTLTVAVVQQIWRNRKVSDNSWQDYFLTGTWSKWNFSKMMHDTQEHSIFSDWVAF